MKRILAWALLVVMLLGMFAGCKRNEDQPTTPTTAPTEAVVVNGAQDAIAYLQAIYKDDGAMTPVNYERFGIVRIGGVPYTVVWTVDVGEDLIKVIDNGDGTVTIDVNEECEADTPYVLTATVTDEEGNTASCQWNYVLPKAADMVAIVEEAYALKSGESLPYQSTLRGEIISIDTVFNPEYNNITVTIAVKGAEDKPIQCYRLKGEGIDKLQVGNIITVTGTLKNYNGTIEFDAGCMMDAWEKGNAVEAPTDVGEILKAAYALSAGTALPYPVTLTGTVTKIDSPYDASYGNISVVIEMEGYAKYPILCYRLKGNEVEKVAVKDQITVTGIIKNYNGKIEFDSGCIMTARVSGGNVAKPESSDAKQIMADAAKLSSGQSLDYYATLTGKVTEIQSPYDKNYGNITVVMVVSGYESKPIICYRLKSGNADVSKIAKGDTITVRGLIENYQGKLEFGSGCVLNNRISGGNVAKPESSDQAAILADAAKLGQGQKLDYYATLTGKVTSIDTPYDSAYGNISVYIDVNGTSMLCYRLKSGAANASKIAAGDTITVRGVIENYKGALQFGSGSTLENRVSGGGVAKPESSNASQILADAAQLAQGQKLEYYASLTGKVIEIDTPYDSSYGNISVIIDVDGTQLLCYRLKSGAYNAAKIAKDDTITVRGVIENYKGEIQFGSGCTLEYRKSGGGVAKPESTDQAAILADAAQLASGEKLDYYATLTGVVTKITSPYDPGYGNATMNMKVGDIEIQCYRLKSGSADVSKVKVGDTITVRGVIENYNGKLEFLAGSTLQKLVPGTGEDIGGGDEPGLPEGGNTISFADKANRVSLSDDQQVWKQNGITVTNDKAASTSNIADYANPVRFYKGTKVTVEYPEMTRLVFDVAFEDKVAALTDSLAGMADVKVTVDGLMVTVDLYTATNAFVIEKMANQTRLKAITVYTGTTPPEGGEGGGESGGEGGMEGEITGTVTELKAGDQVVIFAPAYGKALSADKVNATSYYNKGVNVSIANGALTGYGAAETWTVIVNSDGTYSFANGGKNIALAAEFSSMQLGEVNDDWQVIGLGGSLYNIKNTGRGNFIEWYSSKDNWSTYNSTSAASDDQFQLSFYVIGKGLLTGEGSGEVTPPTPPTPPAGGGSTTSALKNGDQVVIFAPAYGKALSADKVTATSYYNKGVDVTLSNGVLSGYGAAETWTVIVNSDGTYSFANGGKNIALAAEFSSMQLGEVNDDWQVISLGGSLYNIKNTGRGNFMEWYSSKDNWSTYGASNAASDDQFQLSFYVIGKGVLEESGSGEGGGNEGGNQGGTVTPPAGGETATGLQTGDQVVIFAPAYGKALSADKVTATSYYNKGVDVTLSNGVLSGYGAAETWTVTKNADGTYSFANGGKNIALAAEFSSMQLGEVNDDWQVISLGGSLYNIKNTGRGNFMEWYSSKDNWSTYGASNAASDDQFQLSFYVIGKGVLTEDGNQGGTVTPPAGGDQGGTVTPPAGDDAAALQNGDQVVIFAPAYGKALSADKVTATSYYNKGVDVTLADGVLSGYGAAETWTVIANSDGTFSFANGGKNIALAAEFSSMQLGEANDDWQVIGLGGSLYNIKNTGRGNFMEWYSSKDNWSTYNSSSAATDDQFQLSFYVIGKGVLTDGTEGGGNEGGNQGGTVTPPAGGDQGGTEVEMKATTITFDDIAKRTVLTEDQQVWVENGITFTNDKGASTSPINGQYFKPVRCYKNSSVKVEFEDMLKIEFDCNYSTYAAALKKLLGDAATVNGNIVTVTFAEAQDSYVIEKLSEGQVRFSSITVYTAA